MSSSMLQVVFATAVTKPGHGNIAPLAIGFTLFASAFVGEGTSHRRRPGCTALFSFAFWRALCQGHSSFSGLMQGAPPQELL